MGVGHLPPVFRPFSRNLQRPLASPGRMMYKEIPSAQAHARRSGATPSTGCPKPVLRVAFLFLTAF